MKDNFPTVYDLCIKNNINPIHDPIPISPAAHYHMGGIACDEYGRSSVDGLYVCGENACSGIHGANRLASNSLLEAIVFADIISNDIKINSNNMNIGNYNYIPPKVKKLDMSDLNRLRDIMTKYVGVERDQKGLEKAFKLVKDIYLKYNNSGYKNNSIITALLIIKSAINRTEHRGSHYRIDYPIKNVALTRRSKITYEELKI
tara:strand:- start:387 stop:995 length:609 start_codon:yes stop_codon:yes gene_type:complete